MVVHFRIKAFSLLHILSRGEAGNERFFRRIEYGNKHKIGWRETMEVRILVTEMMIYRSL